jgi:hypothetical protein
MFHLGETINPLKMFKISENSAFKPYVKIPQYYVKIDSKSSDSELH